MLGAVLLGGCEDRDRLVFLGPGDGIGPETVITFPGRDTVIDPSTGVVIDAFSRDPDGLDTVYVRTFGPAPSFQPITPGGDDSVRFGLPIGTVNLSQDTIIVLLFATDLRGNRGDTAERIIYIP